MYRAQLTCGCPSDLAEEEERERGERRKKENICPFQCHLKLLHILFLFQGFHYMETTVNNLRNLGCDQT